MPGTVSLDVIEEFAIVGLKCLTAAILGHLGLGAAAVAGDFQICQTRSLECSIVNIPPVSGPTRPDFVTGPGGKSTR